MRIPFYGARGWGGPPRGKGNGRPKAPPFQPGNQAAVKKPETQEMRDRKELRKLTPAERKEEYISELHDIGADKNTPPGIRVSAIVHILDRDIGKPGPESESGATGKTIVVRGGLPPE